MLDLDKIDFKKLGFRAGLEVHHQIQTKRKLFCNCVAKLSDGEPDYRFERYFRPVLGEMGDFDAGMLIEFEKGYRVIYHAYEETVCCYEQDEQPPFWPDLEAIYKGYELAHWLNFTAMVDEVVVSRKQYLDGSITTGFQRTMIVARDGFIPINGKKIRLSNLTVEEDAARKIKTENFGRTVYYNLDRLGIPLVEVITDHRDCDNPYDLQKLAEYIGLTLRLSGIGRRGIGSVRQDVNISIAGGDRVEIKGVQDLSMFIELAKREVVRQDMLLKIKKQLKKRGLKKSDLEHTYTDLTELFEPTLIPENYLIFGIRLPKFGGILKQEIQPGKDFGQDIIEKAELISGVPRFYQYHSDELSPKALRKQQEQKKTTTEPENFFFKNITKALDNKIKTILHLQKEDAYFLVMGPQKWTIHAMKKIIERAKMALDGVPQETRRLLPDGNTEFLRVIHGKDRLYPDTDTPPIDMDLQKIKELKKKVKERPWELVEELKEKYGFTYQQVVELIRHDRIVFLKELIEEHHFEPKKCYVFLEEILRALKREGLPVERLSREHIFKILEITHNGVCDFNQAQNIARKLIAHPEKKLKQVLSDLKIRKFSEKDFDQLFKVALAEVQQKEKTILSDKKRLANKITGEIMRKINGGYSGRSLSKLVLTKIEEMKN